MKWMIVIAGILLSQGQVWADGSEQHWGATQRSALSKAKKMSATKCEIGKPAKIKTNCVQDFEGKPKTRDSGPNKKLVWMCELSFDCVEDPNWRKRK